MSSYRPLAIPLNSPENSAKPARSKARALVLYAHPEAHNPSRVGTALLDSLTKAPAKPTIHRLYDQYPHLLIDNAKKEHRLLKAHDLIIMQFPFYWYSAPPLLKAWMDEVLTLGFAYGSDRVEGNALRGKHLWPVITAGGSRLSYSSKGYNRLPIEAFLTPFEQTARLCQMIYHPPLVFYSAIDLSNKDIEQSQLGYVRALEEKLQAINQASFASPGLPPPDPASLS